MEEILAPKICPDCAGTLVHFTDPKSSITTIWCQNTSCPGRVADTLTFVASRGVLEIDGLGPEMAKILVGLGYVLNLNDLFQFGEDAERGIQEYGPEKFIVYMNQKQGIPGAACVSMVKSLRRAKTDPWDRWLMALGIPMIGAQSAKLLAKTLALQPTDMGKLPDLLNLKDSMQIDGFGPQKRSELNRYTQTPSFKQLCQGLSEQGITPASLAEKVSIETGTSPLKGMVFCVTGEFDSIGSREYIIQELEKLGAVNKSGVSRKLSHLLVGREAGSTKIKKGIELNIPQLDANWLSQTFEANGVVATKKADGSFNLDWAD